MSLLYFWNTWDKIITFLMSFFFVADFNICVNSLLVYILMDFAPLLWVIFSFFFPHLLIFDWIPDVVNFTLLAAGNVGIYTNILRLCSGFKILLGLAFKIWEPELCSDQG